MARDQAQPVSENSAKLKAVVGLLAGKNCGKCGYPNCGKFALALVEGQALPLDCHHSRDNLEALCLALSIAVPQAAVSPAGPHHPDLNHHRAHHGRAGFSRAGEGRGHVGHRHAGRHGDHRGGNHQGKLRRFLSLF